MSKQMFFFFLSSDRQKMMGEKGEEKRNKGGVRSELDGRHLKSLGH